MLFILYFLSGFSALIYEVVWLRKLELVFGTTTYAVSTILAVFFTGLAIGAWVFGKIADKHNFQFSNLQLYGFLEIGIGMYAVLTPWIFKLIESLQVIFWQTFEPSLSGFNIFTFLLSTIALLIPTVLMGGTFPVAVAAATSLKKADKKLMSADNSVGWLYGLNTSGGVMGTLLAGFWLIASIGVNQTIWVAALISLIIGGMAVYMSRMNYFFFLSKVGKAIRNNTRP